MNEWAKSPELPDDLKDELVGAWLSHTSSKGSWSAVAKNGPRDSVEISSRAARSSRFPLSTAIALALGCAGTTQADAYRLAYTRDGAGPGDFLGSPIGHDNVGDINQDGFADFMSASVNAQGARGRVEVISGRFAALGEGLEVLGVFTGNQAGDRFGQYIAALGDVNLDGFPDVAVGADQYSVGAAGYVKVLSGRYIAEGTEPQVLYSKGGANGDILSVVAGAGDVNADGYPDLVIGAWEQGFSFNRPGYSIVVSGAYMGAAIAPEILCTNVNGTNGDSFGSSVDGVGDVDNDGYEDYAIGAYTNGPPGQHHGRANVYSGRTCGLMRSLNGSLFGERLGVGVSGIGDVNGDGFKDVLVTADEQGLSPYLGSARVWSGAHIVNQTQPAVLCQVTGSAQLDIFGQTPCGLGDVNGDGHPDWAVGARQLGSNPGPGYLRVFSGIDCSMLHEFQGEMSGDHFGVWASSIGDLDGDSINDLVIGAPQNDAGTGNNADNRGRIYVYLSGPECGGPPDCNTNGTADDCDIASGTSADCDTNGVPDECDPDYDADGLIDPCDPDMDNDGVANAADVCDFTPAGAAVQPDGTLRTDIDGDCDVDLADHAIMAEEFTGPRT